MSQVNVNVVFACPRCGETYATLARVAEHVSGCLFDPGELLSEWRKRVRELEALSEQVDQLGEMMEAIGYPVGRHEYSDGRVAWVPPAAAEECWARGTAIVVGARKLLQRLEERVLDQNGRLDDAALARRTAESAPTASGWGVRAVPGGLRPGTEACLDDVEGVDPAFRGGPIPKYGPGGGSGAPHSGPTTVTTCGPGSGVAGGPEGGQGGGGAAGEPVKVVTVDGVPTLPADTPRFVQPSTGKCRCCGSTVPLAPGGMVIGHRDGDGILCSGTATWPRGG
jgi:hypothetical protein